MAALTLGNQTLAALLEVGDQLRTGVAAEDFVTILTRWTRPTYVKLEVRLFDQSRQILRVTNTDAVTILPPWEAPVEDEADEEVEV